MQGERTFDGELANDNRNIALQGLPYNIQWKLLCAYPDDSMLLKNFQSHLSCTDPTVSMLSTQKRNM